MRKYGEIVKLSFKAQLVYRFDVVLGAVFSVTKILLAFVLWGAIFEGRAQVGGFGFQDMLSYYILSALLTQMDLSGGIAEEIAARVRDGSFSKYMVLPVRPSGYFAAQTAGAACYYLGFNLLAALVWTGLFRVRFSLSGDPGAWLGALALMALGLAFMMQFHFFLGILAFRFQEIGVFLMVKNSLLAFATGSLIPLALLPEGVISLLRALPFYSVTYLPTMVMMGRNAQELGTGLLSMLCWNAGFWVLNRLCYRRLRTRYDGVGL